MVEMINFVLYVCVCVFCCAQLFATPWIVAHQAPLSMGFSRQEYRSELTFLSPEDLPDTGIPCAPPALAGRFFTTEPPGKLFYHSIRKNKLEGFSLGFPSGSDSKASACSVGDLGSIPGLRKSPGEGNGNPLQYSCLENSTD